jgi:hypothetical protein
VRALANTAREFYAAVKEQGTTDPFRSRMLDFESLNQLIGTPDMLAQGRAYAGKRSTGDQAKGRR